jgi:hypothetical protein
MDMLRLFYVAAGIDPGVANAAAYAIAQVEI